MREIIKKEWPELQPIWNELINGNPIATPFQSYEFLSFTGKGKPHRKALFRTVGLQELNLVLYSDHVPIAIAPLLLKKKKGETTVYFRGQFTVANQLDFIYSDISYDDFAFFMDGIRELLGNVSFWLDRVYYKSPTSDYLQKYLPSEQTHKTESYAIPISESYDDWYNSLHKSVRRNLITTRNRIKNDNVQCTASFFIREKIDPDLYKKMMLVYADRFLTKNNFRFGPFQYWIKKALQSYLLSDKVTQWLNDNDDSFHVIVYMNNEIAAFASGLICRDKRIIANRLAMNTKFRRYYPGVVLLSSTVSYLAEQKKANRTDFEKLDLSQGARGDMSYKITYGGEEYYNYFFN